MPEITCVCGVTYNPGDASAVRRHESTQHHRFHSPVLPEGVVPEPAAEPEPFADLDLDATEPQTLEEIADAIVPSGETRAKAVKQAKAKVAAKVAKPVLVKTTGSKSCRVCGVEKPLSEYRVKATRPDGRDTICGACAKAYDQARAEAKKAAK